jgi:hypothetical protein
VLPLTRRNHSTHHCPKPLTRHSLVLGGHRVAGRPHAMGHRCASREPSPSDLRLSFSASTTGTGVLPMRCGRAGVNGESGRKTGSPPPVGRDGPATGLPAVGEADRDGPSGEVVAGAGCFDEFRQDVRFGLNVRLIHPAIWKAMEEGIPVLCGNCATNAELCRLRYQFGGQGHEVEFVAARAMQQHKRRTNGICARKEAVGVYRVGMGARPSDW